MAIVPLQPSSVGARLVDWQLELKSAIRDPIQLCRELELPLELAHQAHEGERQFPLFAPRSFVRRIEKGNPCDPLLLQVLPLASESNSSADFTTDPVGDLTATIAPGIIQKYHGRALLIATGACAINCRYCFRRHFPYHEAPKGELAWESSLEVIRSDSSISEVILSGGDPLVLNDAGFQRLVRQIESIGHVERLRIHSRLPIMIPARINSELIQTLQTSRLVAIVVIHCNHANEIDCEVGSAIAQLIEAGIPVLNQSVLLRNVNDNIEALVELSEILVASRVMPYYLNALDRVQGAAHFEVETQKGVELVEEMRTKLPGYAVPRFVTDSTGERSKTILA